MGGREGSRAHLIDSCQSVEELLPALPQSTDILTVLPPWARPSAHSAVPSPLPSILFRVLPSTALGGSPDPLATGLFLPLMPPPASLPAVLCQPPPACHQREDRDLVPTAPAPRTVAQLVEMRAIPWLPRLCLAC